MYTLFPLPELKAALYDGAPEVAELQVSDAANRVILGLCWADMRPEGLWGRKVSS